MLRGVVPVATCRPHLHVFLVQVLVGLTHQILVIVNDLRLLEATMLFLESLPLCEVLWATTAANTLARVEVLLVVLVVLQQTLVGCIGARVGPVCDINAFISIDTLRFLPKVLAH